MFDTEVATLDAAATLAAADEARAIAAAAEVRLLEVAAHWADLHAVVEAPTVLPGAERLVPLGGDGTPDVAEFAPAELGAVLATSTHAAAALLADALDLRHRLPRLWARTAAGKVKPWVARRTAEATRTLPAPLAAKVDAAVAPFADRLSWGRLERLVEATWMRLDPERAALAERATRDDLGVWVGRSYEHGTGTLFARLESLDALRLDAAVQRGADALAALGDTRAVDVRRATALGTLADPQAAIDLYDAHAERVDPAHEPSPRRPAGTTAPGVQLVVHLTDETLRAGDGIARVEGVGPVTAGLVRDWLTGGGATAGGLVGREVRMTVRPLIDLGGMAPVDGYEVPPRMAEAVRFRSPLEAFPYGTGRGRDLDHTDPYRHPDEGGPPGQTRTDNLGPLTRQHHRLKTFGRWQVRQVWDGVFAWRSPHGRHYLVDATGTARALPAA